MDQGEILITLLLIAPFVLMEKAPYEQNAEAHQRTCMDSNKTIVEVGKCPGNKEQWEKAARRKSCHLITQECCSPEKFQYHCIMDEKAEKLLEVCAPVYNIIGRRCPEFNSIAQLVQSQDTSFCKNFVPPCPFSYPSNTLYKYQECYDFVRKETLQNKSVTIDTNGMSLPEDDLNSKGNTNRVCNKPVLLALTLVIMVF